MSTAVVDSMTFRNAMARFASGVTVVTTRDEAGAPWAFTASAFSSLSLDPPLVLVCLEKRAESHPAFMSAESFAVSILADSQGDTAWRFAKRGTDKFAGIEMESGAHTGLPLVPDALVQLECRMHERLDGGDHTILVGEVLDARLNEGAAPLLHYNRQFGRFDPEDPTS
jgi:flavin reductase ActVB